MISYLTDKNHLPNYHKNDLDIFKKVNGDDKKGLDRAIKNTQLLRKFLKNTDSKLPSTDMDKLVKALYSIQKEK